MKERPILFSVPMVRAILDGTKTQARRVVKFPLRFAQPDFIGGKGDDKNDPANWGYETDAPGVFATLANGIPCPHGKPGDRLWVRENFKFHTQNNSVLYKADGDNQCQGFKWKPSIHMPRTASRITLKITDVRVERLQDISDSDAIAEGISLNEKATGVRLTREESETETLSRALYRDLLKRINGPESWDANPWVWVIEFKRCEHGNS